MNDPSESLFLENQICFPLYAASRLTTKLYAPHLEKMDVTYPQYLVLLVLWQYKVLSVKEIGHRLFLESNTLTPLLKRLEKKELIRRNRSREDERAVIVSLTRQGKDLKKEALSIPHKIAESFRDSSIDKDEIRRFQKTLFGLVDILGSRVAADRK